MWGVFALLSGAELCFATNRDLSSGHTGDYLHSQRSCQGHEHGGKNTVRRTDRGSFVITHEATAVAEMLH